MLPLLSSTLPNDRHLHYTNILHRTTKRYTGEEAALPQPRIPLYSSSLSFWNGLENDHQKVGTAGGLEDTGGVTIDGVFLEGSIISPPRRSLLKIKISKLRKPPSNLHIGEARDFH